MTKKQYITQLTSSEKSLCGKDIPQDNTASVIDGLCDVIADKETIISERDKQIAKMHDETNWLKRKLFGRSSERLHAEDPNQLSFGFGEEKVVPLTPDELKATEEKVSETINEINFGRHSLIRFALLVSRRNTMSGRCRMILHASSRHSSASSTKKSVESPT